MLRPLFSVFLFLIISCNQAERNCNEFKTGTFEFTYMIEGAEKTTRFKRTKNLNVDFMETGNDTASIRWINNCEFIQKAKKPKSKQEEAAIHFKILSTTQNSYTFEYSLAIKPTNRAHRVERGTATKIDE